MSHLDSRYYKKKVEKTEKEGNKIIHICSYELKDGGYVLFKDVMETSSDSEEPTLYSGKTVQTIAIASDEIPEIMIREEKSNNLKRLAEIAKKLI